MNYRAHPGWRGYATQRRGGHLRPGEAARPPASALNSGGSSSQIARAVGASLGRLLAQLDDFVREPVDELLLLVDGQVQLIQQVFCELALISSASSR